jgi:phosphate-selective porin O/P
MGRFVVRSPGLGVALLCCPALLLGQYTPHVGGYFQARETYQSSVGLTASVNRARVSADGGLPQHFSYRLLVEYEANGTATTAAGVSLRDAYIRWQSEAFTVTAGQFKVPFSREFITSITTIETADRATVVDSLAPKRDIGIMGEWRLSTLATFSLGLYNGDGQNRPSNRDSTLMVSGRLSLRPIPLLTVAAEVARYNRDSTRYGADGSLEWRGVILRGEYIAQQRRLARPVDWGYFGLAAYRVEPWLQVVLKRERFQRPAIGSAQYNAATTGGVNVDLPGGRTRIIADYVSRRIAFPGTVTRSLVTQLQVRF